MQTLNEHKLSCRHLAKIIISIRPVTCGKEDIEEQDYTQLPGDFCNLHKKIFAYANQLLPVMREL